MSSRDTAEFLALAAIWGASFLFMRIAAPEFGPLSLMLVRCAVGAATLLPVLLWHGKGRELVAHAPRLFLVGVLNSAIPFVLLGYATLALSAGVTSILNSLAPLWTALIAWLWLGDRLTRAQALGLCLGAIGVAILVGGGGGEVGVDGGGAPDATGPGMSAGAGIGLAALSFAAGILAALFYGVSANFTRRYLVGVHPLATATGSQLSATLVLLVPGLLTWPARVPDANPEGASVLGHVAPLLGAVSPVSWLAAVTLGVVCTGVAYLLFFRLIASVGATRTIAVTFVIPLFGVGWGALFLGELVDVATLAGGAVIVLGTALTTGVLRSPGGRSTP